MLPPLFDIRNLTKIGGLAEADLVVMHPPDTLEDMARITVRPNDRSSGLVESTGPIGRAVDRAVCWSPWSG